MSRVCHMYVNGRHQTKCNYNMCEVSIRASCDHPIQYVWFISIPSNGYVTLFFILIISCVNGGYSVPGRLSSLCTRVQYFGFVEALTTTTSVQNPMVLVARSLGITELWRQIPRDSVVVLVPMAQTAVYNVHTTCVVRFLQCIGNWLMSYNHCVYNNAINT